MWIMMNDSYFSVVKNRDKKDHLLVRARVEGDIERVFPKAKVIEGAGTDYKYRASIPKWIVSKIMRKEIEKIDYDNFKDSIPATDDFRHDVYFEVWTKLMQLQRGENEYYKPKEKSQKAYHPKWWFNPLTPGS